MACRHAPETYYISPLSYIKKNVFLNYNKCFDRVRERRKKRKNLQTNQRVYLESNLNKKKRSKLKLGAKSCGCTPHWKTFLLPIYAKFILFFLSHGASWMAPSFPNLAIAFSGSAAGAERTASAGERGDEAAAQPVHLSCIRRDRVEEGLSNPFLYRFNLHINGIRGVSSRCL